MAKCYVRIGNNEGMCNYSGIGLHFREISLNDCMLPLQYEVNLKRLTLQTHLTLSSLNIPAQIIYPNNVLGVCQDRWTDGQKQANL